MSSSVIPLNRFHDQVARIYRWCIETLDKLPKGINIKELEIEFGVRANKNNVKGQGRTSDLGHPASHEWRRMLTDTVIAIQDEQQSNHKKTKHVNDLKSNDISDLKSNDVKPNDVKPSEIQTSNRINELYEQIKYTDHFYLDGSTRQRMFPNSNQVTQWIRKQKLDIDPLVFDFEDTNSSSNSNKKSIPLSCKIQIKHEKPIIPLPQTVPPIWTRNKSTQRFCFPQHPYCMVELSEVQTVQYFNGSNRGVEDKNLIYELEIQWFPDILEKILDKKMHPSDNNILQYRGESYFVDIWCMIADCLTQLYEILNLEL